MCGAVAAVGAHPNALGHSDGLANTVDAGLRAGPWQRPRAR